MGHYVLKTVVLGMSCCFACTIRLALHAALLTLHCRLNRVFVAVESCGCASCGSTEYCMVIIKGP